MSAAALVLLCAAAVVAKPPGLGAGAGAGAGGAAPWAKPGMSMRRSPLGAADASADEAAAPGFPPGYAPGFPPGYAPGFAPGLAFNPLYAAPGSSPLLPFLKLKPVKPTFLMPPVDPSKFIDMKTSLLSGLFAGISPAATATATATATDESGPSTRALAGGGFFDPAAAGAAGPSPLMKPPPPAFLADLFKVLNINKTVANASDATAPAGFPFAPTPLVDPGVIISKKAKFLSDLFASTSTTTPPPTAAAAPSVVPPDFWLPTAGSVSYADKVSTFLDKLFDSLNISQPSAGKRSAAEDPNLKYQLLERAAVFGEEPEDEMLPPGVTRGMRSAEPASDDPVALLADAKGKVVDTIIGELVALKDNMIGALSDFAVAQKAAALAAAAAAGPAGAKKPMSPFAAMWAKPSGKPGAPTAAPVIEPVLQRVTLLGQVFDMLTNMEKDITSAMVMENAGTSETVSTPAAPVDLMEVFKAKIHEIMAQNSTTPANSTASARTAPKALRLVEGPPPGAGASLDPTFWIPDSIAMGPDAYLAKTKEFLSNMIGEKAATTSSPLTRRSNKWYGQQEAQTKTSQQQQPQPLPSVPLQRMPPSSQDIIQSVRDPLMELYRERHHHHHQNRQPYWWN